MLAEGNTPSHYAEAPATTGEAFSHPKNRQNRRKHDELDALTLIASGNSLQL